jgi:hypothetical protein
MRHQAGIRGAADKEKMHSRQVQDLISRDKRKLEKYKRNIS